VFIVVALIDAFEFYNALHADHTTSRPPWFLGGLIFLEIGILLGLSWTCTFATFGFFPYDDGAWRPVSLAVAIFTFISVVTHFITMSFVCREADLRRKFIKRQKKQQELEHMLSSIIRG